MYEISRRRLLAGVIGATGLGLAAGCAGQRAAGRGFAWSAEEKRRLAAGTGKELAIVTRGGAGARVLRRRARAVPAALDLTDVARRMEAAMRQAGGVGLAGPQVGLALRIATLMLDYRTEHPRVVFVRNPVIVERSDDCQEGYEGCLSIPGVGGLVRRNRWIMVEYLDSAGNPASSWAEGANAVLWQHELDHLDGVLYTDRLLGELLPMDEVRRRRRQAERKRAGAGGDRDAARGEPMLA